MEDNTKKEFGESELTKEELNEVSGGTFFTAGTYDFNQFIRCGHECITFTNHYHEDGRRLYYCYECKNLFYSPRVIISLAPEMLGYTALSQAELDKLIQDRESDGRAFYKLD